MSLIIQPVNRAGVLCFSGERTLETKDIQLALGVAGVRRATLKTANRTEERYCLEVMLQDPLVHIDSVEELVALLESLVAALGMFEAQYVLGPERRLAGHDAESFADWLRLNEA